MSKYMQLAGCAAAPTKVLGAALEKQPVMTGFQLGASILGGAVGSLLWEDHPVLGLFGGWAVGDSVGLVQRNHADDIPYALAPTGAGIGLSLAWKKHPAWGYILGSMGTALMTAAIPTSPAGRVLAGKSI